MKKKLAGFAVIVSSLALAIQLDQKKTGELPVKQEKVAETTAIPSAQLPVMLVETIDG
jgi:hypothetical protein